VLLSVAGGNVPRLLRAPGQLKPHCIHQNSFILRRRSLLGTYARGTNGCDLHTREKPTSIQHKAYFLRF
jgi:hypothetical protein